MATPDIKINVDLLDLKTALKDIATSIDRLNKSIDTMGQKTTQGMGNAAKRTKSVTTAINRQTQELNKLHNKIESYSRRYSELTKKELRELKKLRAERDRMKKTIREQSAAAVSGANRAAAAQGRLNKQVSLGRQLFLRLKSVMLTVFGAYAIIQGIRNTINIVKEFELGMARLNAITGATAEEMDSLTASAIRMSKTSIFNAKEIAEVQVQLAKFGFTLNEITASTDGIIKLATATGEDLGGAATLVSSSIRALGLSAKETGRLVDVLGKSFTGSALDIDKFRESAKFILPLARQMGWTIEEVAATLAKMADSGISGSLAGTGLRTTFIELWDASSDLSEILGAGIRTFDDFFGAIEKAKEEGISFERVLETIPKRAKTMFTVLWNTTKQIRGFADEAKNATGSIKEMADIQMDTLAYQMERFNSAWGAFVLSIQNDGGDITNFFRGVSNYLNEWSRGLDNTNAELADAQKRFEDFMTMISVAGTGSLTGELKAQIELVADEMKPLQEQVEEFYKELKKGLDNGTIKRSEIEFYRQARGIDDAEDSLKGYTEEIRLLNEALYSEQIAGHIDAFTSSIERAATALVDDGVPAIDAFRQGYQEQIDILNDLRHLNPKVYDDIIDAVNKYYTKNMAIIRQREELISQGRKKRAEEELARQQAILDAEEKNMNLRAGRIDDEQAREEQLLAIQSYFAIKRLELLVKYGDLEEDLLVATKEQIIELEKTFDAKMLEITRKFTQELIEEDIKRAENRKSVYEKVNNDLIAIQKVRNAIELQEMRNNGEEKDDITRRRIEQLIELKEKEIEAAEAGEDEILVIIKLREELALLNAELQGVGLGIEDNVKNIAKIYRKLAEEIIDSFQTIVDAQVENTSRLVDDLDTRIAETQRSLDQELLLYTNGYANNVTAKRNELAELKKARDEALADREQAIKRQQQLEAISQSANLFSAVAKVINTYAAVPGIGFAIAGGVVAAFLGLFKAAQSSIKNITQFGDGGKLDGNSHANGGVMVEGEGGEWIINKKMSAKHDSILRAINEDNLPSLNASVLNETTFDRSGNVIVNNEIWDKMYNLWEKNLNSEKIDIRGNKKIITRGIRKRVIKNV